MGQGDCADEIKEEEDELDSFEKEDSDDEFPKINDEI